jgi:hypothetical protein
VADRSRLVNNVPSFRGVAASYFFRIGAPLEMNTPTPFSTNSDDTELSDLTDDAESAAKREGLPAGFRMRANAHYVDQLETTPRPALRHVAISAIENETLRDAPEQLTASVRRHGILQPLIVQHDPRGRQYRLLAGRGRLAAARAAGLREVPCIVHTISDAEAADLMEAVRATAGRTESAPQPSPGPAVALYPAQRELESALTTIESCTPLLQQTSAAARRAALQVIVAECRRSQRLVRAMRALTDAVPMRRILLKPGDLFARLGEAFREEQGLLGLEPVIHVNADPQLAFYGDDDLLLTAMTSSLSALTAAAGDRLRDVAFIAMPAPAGGAVVLELTDRSLVLSESFVRTAFTNAWPVTDGDTILLLLQAARRIVSTHGGSITAFSDTTRTTIRLQLPADQIARPVIDRAAN